eukprot:6120473-Lingulodinium_polyedra.AAC.1
MDPVCEAAINSVFQGGIFRQLIPQPVGVFPRGIVVFLGCAFRSPQKINAPHIAIDKLARAVRVAAVGGVRAGGA